MLIVQKTKVLLWTLHVQAKMRRYGLSKSRVLRILHAPKRVEEGIAPDTMAAMQPVNTRYDARIKEKKDGKDGPTETWKQELWVMVQDKPKHRIIISAWRYPGMTKERSGIAMNIFRQEYGEYLEKAASEMDMKDAFRPKIKLASRWRPALTGEKKKWPSRPFRSGSRKSNVIMLDQE